MAPLGGLLKEEVDSNLSLTNTENDSNTLVKSESALSEMHGSSSLTGVHKLLQCPGCRNFMYPPIQQCPNGHALCVDCKIRARNTCPTCHFDLGDIRCLALEKVAETLELPCKFQNLGCQDIYPYYDKLSHEQRCRFRPYDCPYAGSMCSITGDIPTLVAHLKEEHKVDMHEGSSVTHRYIKYNHHEEENVTWMVTVFSCYERHFCLHFEAFQIATAPVYMAFLRFMGEENEARKYSYTLEVSGNGRKLTWQGVPRSIRIAHERVRDSQDGLVIPRGLALFFSGGDGQELKLRVKGQIWKTL